MIAGADAFIDAIAHPHHAFAAFDFFGIDRTDAALAFQLAFALGDDDFQTFVRGGECLTQGLHHVADVVVMHRAHPLDAGAGQG